MSICSEHMLGKEDPNCPRCRAELEFELFDDRIVTCSSCNFVFYKSTDICPKCQTENI